MFLEPHWNKYSYSKQKIDILSLPWNWYDLKSRSSLTLINPLFAHSTGCAVVDNNNVSPTLFFELQLPWSAPILGREATKLLKIILHRRYVLISFER